MDSRGINVKAFTELIFPTTQTILIDECYSINWNVIYESIQKTVMLRNLSCAWIEYTLTFKNSVDFTNLNVRSLTYLNISHVTIDDCFFQTLPDYCPNLSILIMLDAKTVSHATFRSSSFKTHRNLKLLNISYSLKGPGIANRETLCAILYYSCCHIRIDIAGIYLTDDDYEWLLDSHEDAFDRIVDLENYRHLLY